MEHNQHYLHYLHSKSEWFSNFLHFSYHVKLKVFLTLPTLLHSRKLCSNFCVKFTILSFEKFMIFQLLWTLPTLPTFANIRNIHNIQDTKKWKSVTNRAISIAHCEDKYKSQKIIPANDSKPTRHPICVFETYWWMWLENFENWSKNDQKRPKNVENKTNWPKNIQKVRKLLQNSYSGQKARDLPLKFYWWSPNILGNS